MMEPATATHHPAAFAARRPAASGLTQSFHLPPPNNLDNTPSMDNQNNSPYPPYNPPPRTLLYPIPTPSGSGSGSDNSPEVPRSHSHHYGTPLQPQPIRPSQNFGGVASSEGISPLTSNIGTTSQPPQSNPLSSSGYGYGQGSWPTPGSASSSSYVYSGSQDQSASNPLGQSSYGNPSPTTAGSNAGRGVYSPSMNYNTRGSIQSPQAGASGAGDGISGAPPTGSYSLPPYSSASSQPTVPSQSQAPHQSQHQPQQQSILSSQAPVSQSHSRAPSHGPPDTYSTRPPPSQPYYPQASTPQQSTFPAFAHTQRPTPNHPPPVSTSAQSQGLVPALSPHSPGMPPPPPQGQYGGHQPLAYTGFPPGLSHSNQVLSNLSNPNTPMTIVRTVGPGGHPYLHGFYPPSAQPNERPFRCDTCPQSFNRNHDLKRHKRIHLAVKPFPCSHCDKSFSRKDALKRHKLVKGCGSKEEPSSTPATTTADNPAPTAPAVKNDESAANADDSHSSSIASQLPLPLPRDGPPPTSGQLSS